MIHASVFWVHRLGYNGGPGWAAQFVAMMSAASFQPLHIVSSIVAAADRKDIFAVMPQFIDHAAGVNIGPHFTLLFLSPLPVGEHEYRNVLIQIIGLPLWMPKDDHLAMFRDNNFVQGP